MPTYSRLTRGQRYTIEAMNRNGPSQNEIADAIGKHPSTVSHELRRLGVCRNYCFVEAQRDTESKTNGKEFSLHKLLPRSAKPMPTLAIPTTPGNEASTRTPTA